MLHRSPDTFLTFLARDPFAFFLACVLMFTAGVMIQLAVSGVV